MADLLPLLGSGWALAGFSGTAGHPADDSVRDRHTPTEAQALASRGEDYRRYQRTTSAFLPWPPRHAATTAPDVERSPEEQ
jgi:hypothetical protein